MIRLPFSDILRIEPFTCHVTQQRETAPRIEASVEAKNFFVAGDAAAIVRFGELRARPSIQCEAVIPADQLQQIFGGVVTDAFHALDLFHQIDERRISREPALNIKFT